LFTFHNPKAHMTTTDTRPTMEPDCTAEYRADVTKAMENLLTVEEPHDRSSSRSCDYTTSKSCPQPNT